MEDLGLPVLQNVTEKKKKYKGLAPKKKAMIEALARHLGIVTSACQDVKIERITHYRWLKDDKLYAEAVKELDGRKDDVIEKAFLSLVIDRNPQAVIHAVKTKLKYRGYGDTIVQDINLSTNVLDANKAMDIIKRVEAKKNESGTTT